MVPSWDEKPASLYPPDHPKVTGKRKPYVKPALREVLTRAVSPPPPSWSVPRQLYPQAEDIGMIRDPVSGALRSRFREKPYAVITTPEPRRHHTNAPTYLALGALVVFILIGLYWSRSWW